MPIFFDLPASQAALYDDATDGHFFEVCGELLDAKLDPHVMIVRHAPSYAVVVLGLMGDTIQVEREIPIDSGMLDERTRLGLLVAYVEQLCAKHRRFVVMTNPRLLALGVRPIALPR